MTIAWLRVVMKNILYQYCTSPTHQPHPPLHVWQIEWSLVESSQSHICQIVCSFSFIFLWRAIHNLHLWHRIHHVSHHILPPRDSNCWICDIIKHPFVSSLYTLLCHPALSLSFPFRSTHLHLFSPPNRPTRTHMPSSARCMPPKVSRSHMLIQLQRYRMGELWTVLGVYEELVKQKVFSSPAFPFLLLLFTSSYILYDMPFSFYFYAL